jgi:hypothetical protein
MDSLQEAMREYRTQLAKGCIQRAYRGLMQYMMALRTHFEKHYPGFSVPGSLYTGYMDMTYFSIVPEALKERKLKVAIVFLHEVCRFEAWLAGANKQVQVRTWRLFKDNKWDKHRLVPTTEGEDAIVQSVLVEEPDFGNLDALTAQIERGALKFIRDVEGFLAKQD